METLNERTCSIYAKLSVYLAFGLRSVTPGIYNGLCKYQSFKPNVRQHVPVLCTELNIRVQLLSA